MTTPQTPDGPQNTTPPQQQAYRHGALEQPAYAPAGYPQQPYGQAPGRQGHAPQQPSNGQPGYGRPSGPPAPGPQGAAWQAGGQQSFGPGYPQAPGRSGPQRIPGPIGPQQRVPGNTGPQRGPAYAGAAREIPPQPAYGGPAGLPPYPAAAVPRAPRNGFGTTALVLGIIGALFAVIPVIGMIAWPLVILGLIFGVLGIARARSGKADNRGVAISGTVLSAIGLIICIVWASAFSAAVSSTTPAGSTGSSAPAVSADAGDSSVPAAFPGATSNDVVANGGDTLTVADMQVTATALTPGDSVLGGRTLCSTVTYTNTGSTPGNFNGGFDWKLQDPAGAALMTGFSGSDPNSLLSAGDLAPGGKTSGEVCFDRKGAAAGQYVLLYDPMNFSPTRGAWINLVG